MDTSLNNTNPVDAGVADQSSVQFDSKPPTMYPQAPVSPHPAASQAVAVEAKMLLQQAIVQIDTIVLNTLTSPAERARQVHAIKSAYIKARFQIDDHFGDKVGLK